MYKNFAFITNIDSTFLELNPYLEKYGYEFREYKPEEFEKNFHVVFGLPKGYDAKGSVSYKSGRYSAAFEAELMKSAFEWKVSPNDGIFVVFSQIGILTEYDNSKEIKKMMIFLETMIRKLRLFKSGDIEFYKSFMLNLETKGTLVGMFEYPSLFGNCYTINKEEIKEVLLHLNKTVFDNPLCEIGLKNFELSYSIKDTSVRFITLMTALESLFNKGRDQITHIVSRHLALIISENENDFHKNYRRIKNLYSIRSKIVHGSLMKKDELVEPINELSDLVRKAINYALHCQMDKDKLFEHFNAKGFK